MTDAALRALAALRLSRQRAPAREHLPLADGDGAGPADRRRRPAAGGRATANAGDAEHAEPRWEQALDRELAQALKGGERNVGDRLLREFERTLIRRALAHTGGHRMEAAAWLGWGRNTLTRKIQELGMDDELRKGGEHASAAHVDEAAVPRA